MQRFYAAILFIIMFLNMPPFSQLGKLPFLLKHYQTHKQQDPAMTLGKFVSIHYFQCNDLANEKSEHNRLPFKSTDPVQQVISLTPPASAQLPDQHIALLENMLPSYKKQYIPNPVLLNIFRPPKA
jgi:hypothetical protein